MRGSSNFRADGSFADISGRSGDVRYASHSDTKKATRLMSALCRPLTTKCIAKNDGLSLLRAYCDETLGRNDNSINLLKPTYDCFNLLPHLFAFGFANLLKKRAHLWEGISSVLHRCGE